MDQHKRPSADEVEGYVNRELILDLSDLDCLLTAMIMESPTALLPTYPQTELESVQFSFGSNNSQMIPNAVLRCMRQTGLGGVRRLTNYLGFTVNSKGDQLSPFKPQSGDVVLSDLIQDFSLQSNVLEMMTCPVRKPDPGDPAETCVYDSLLHVNVHANVRLAHPGIPHAQHPNADWTKYFLGSAFLLSAVVYLTFHKRKLKTPTEVLGWSRRLLPFELLDEYKAWISTEIPHMLEETMR